MPLAVHDDFIVLQHPLQQIVSGHWNIFSDYPEKYTAYLTDHTPAYPPLYYFAAASFRYFANLLSPTLPAWMDHCWDIYKNVDPELDTLDYYLNLQDFDVYRNLFLIKAHYILFDLIIAWFLLRLITDRKSRLWAFAFWMLNPFTLHSSFAHGQFDLIPTACVLSALFLLQTRHKGPAMLLLSIGSMIKIFPAFFILPALILVSRDRRDLLKLCAWALLPVLFFLLPMVILTDGLVLQFLHHYEVDRRLYAPGLIQQAQKLIFISGFLAVCFLAFRERGGADNKYLEQLTRLFLLILLILFLSTPVELRYFIWLTPLIAPLIVRDPVARWLFILQAVSIIVLRIFPQKTLQFAILMPLLPE